MGAKTSKLGAPGSATLMRTTLPRVPNAGVTGMPYHDSDYIMIRALAASGDFRCRKAI